ncbi:MAG: hypothetical protein NG740_02205 [Omnitrophica bacterium]|nr:hypothetical protein [Candidatus Omnitrophota bacterium]
MVKAIALLSGGLDSILATRVMLEQGISVEAVNFVTAFCTCTAKGKSCLASKSAADNLGIKLKVFEVSKEYFEIIKNPKYGYGSNMNPCLDCRIFTFKKAAEYMRSTGASFVFTGEILGQRPMSQRRDAMQTIERDSGLSGLIVRPLSAKLLEPTAPEKTGLVDREKLLSIKGRSRKPQIRLAKEFGINDYPCPAGGCLLTDPGFAARIRDLMKHTPSFTTNDVQILKTGRHFRLTDKAKLAVGRNEKENNRLTELAQENDTLLFPKDTTGPTALLRGTSDEKTLLLSASIVARYSDSNPNEPLDISYKKPKETTAKHQNVSPVNEPKLTKIRI